MSVFVGDWVRVNNLHSDCGKIGQTIAVREGGTYQEFKVDLLGEPPVQQKIYYGAELTALTEMEVLAEASR